MRGFRLAAAALLALLPSVPALPAGDGPAVRGRLEGVTTWSGEVRVDGDVEIPEGSSLRIEAGTRVLLAERDAGNSGWNANLVEIRVAGEIAVAGTLEKPVTFECGPPPAAAGPAATMDPKAGSFWTWHGIVLLPPSAPGRRREIRGARIESAWSGIQVPKGRAVIEDCVFLRCGFGIEVGSAYADGDRKGVPGGVARPVITGCRFSGCVTGVYGELDGAPSITRSVFAACRTGAGNSRWKIGRSYPLFVPGIAADRCEFHACVEGVHGQSLVTNGIFSGNDRAVSLSAFHSAHATQTDLYALQGNVFAGDGIILTGEAVAGEFTALPSPGYVDDPAALAAALRAPWPPLPKGLALRPDSPARGKAADGGDPGCLGSAAPGGGDRAWTTTRTRLRRPLFADVAAGRSKDDDPPTQLRPQPGSSAGKSWWCRTEVPADGVLRTRTLLGRGDAEATFAWRVEGSGGGPAEIEVNGDLVEAAAWWNGEPVAGTFGPRRFDAVGVVVPVKAKSGINLLVLRAKGRGPDPRLGVAVTLPGSSAPSETPLPATRAGKVGAATITRDRNRGGSWLRMTIPATIAWTPAGAVRLVAADGTPLDARDARIRTEEKLVLLFGPLPEDALVAGCGVVLEGFRAPDGAALDFGPDPFPVAPPTK